MRSRCARGFTLIEVTIAAAILVTIALGTAQLFGIALRHTIEARRQLAMSLLAARKVDDLIVAAASGTLSPSSGGALDRSVAGFADSVSDAGATYVRRWTAAAVDGRADLVAVVVRVTGTEGRAASGPGLVQIGTICEVRR
jgi:prepilin-type N-terminal cleavage/methylation domain-containing protein